MIIRDEKQCDASAIRQVVTDAFGQPEEAALVDALRNSGDVSISLVAEIDATIVGHILFSQLQAPAGCLALAPMAAAPNHQGEGIGTALIREGLARAKKNGWKGVFVLGDPDYYTRFGFSVAMTENFETDYPRPYFMALELTPNALADDAGPVVYAAPFQALE